MLFVNAQTGLPSKSLTTHGHLMLQQHDLITEGFDYLFFEKVFPFESEFTWNQWISYYHNRKRKDPLI
jgi:hypothetical protein